MTDLQIRRDVYSEAIQHCLAQAPIEACGVIAGPKGGALADHLYQLHNAERSNSFYRFDPQEQIAVWKLLDRREQDPVLIYHSHTIKPPFNRWRAELSTTDIRAALDPRIAHMVVDVWQPSDILVRCWRVQDGTASSLTWGVVG